MRAPQQRSIVHWREWMPVIFAGIAVAALAAWLSEEEVSLEEGRTPMAGESIAGAPASLAVHFGSADFLIEVETRDRGPLASQSGNPSQELARGACFSERGAGVPLESIPTVLASVPRAVVASSPYAVALLTRWADVEPRAAADWVTQLPQGTEALVAKVAEVWALNDFPAAWNWSQTLANGRARKMATESALKARIAVAPIEAIREASNLRQDGLVADVALLAARRWAEEAPDAAVAWAAQFPKWKDRQRVLGEVAIGWSAQDGFRAAALAADDILDPEELGRVVPVIVERWAARDPDAAAEWLAGFPASELRSAAIARLQWARSGTPPPPAGLPSEDFEDRSPISTNKPTQSNINP